MAADFAAAYGHLPWRGIWASTRRRAIETAVPLAGRTGLPIVCDGRLDEIDYGSWQGLTKGDIAARDPETFRRWREDPTVGAPGGEDVPAVARRVRAVLDEIIATELDETRRSRRRGVRQRGPILVVSHKTALRALVCGLLGVDLRDYRQAIAQPVGGVTRVSLARDSRGLMARIRDIGDTRHHGAARALGLAVPMAAASWVPLVPQANGDLVGEQQTFGGGAKSRRRDLQPTARGQAPGSLLAP
jgi:probable phosphoglycerate mutase